MDIELIVTLAASLLGTLIGGGAVLASQRMQWRQDERAATTDQVRIAVEELVVRASSLDMASHQAVSLVGGFATVGGQLNRLIRIVTPLDQQALFAPMNIHYEALNRAAARLRLTQNQELIDRTNAVMFASAGVIEAHAAQLHNSPLLRLVRLLLPRLRPAGHDKIAEARDELGAAVRSLVEQTREQLDFERVDLSALP